MMSLTRRSERIWPNWEQIAQMHNPFTPGELYLAKFLDQYLSNEWSIFVQPFLNGARPDIVVFNPSVGLMIFEVKDWNLAHYEWKGSECKRQLHVRDGRGSYPIASPIEQVECYRKEFVGLLVPALGEMLSLTPKGLGVIKTGVYFHNASTKQVQQMFDREKREYLPLFGRDLLAAQNLERIMPDANRKESKFWETAWNEEVLFWLRPPHHSIEQGTAIKLTSEQERFAEPRSGHSLLRGVVGSGKTLVLAQRAARLASSGLKVLVLTYNITLRHYVRDLIRRVPCDFDWKNIEIVHFHLFCRRVLLDMGCPWPKGSGEVFFQEQVPKAVWDAIAGKKYNTYDAILIDEGQDFHHEWYKLLCEFLSKRNELLIVCDKKQNVYGRELSWLDKNGSPIKRIGDLKTVFRLPLSIAKLANNFSHMYHLDQEVPIEKVAQLNLFEQVPHVVWRDINAQRWIENLKAAFERLKREHCSSSDIVLLLPTHDNGLVALKAFTEMGYEVNHVFAPSQQLSRFRKLAFWMGDGRMKMSTIHSFKGWEVHNVILYIPETITEWALYDSVIYTALTRTRTNLIVLNANARYSPFGSHLPHTWDNQV
jgi:AAA domain/Nuclease-related domain